MSPVTAQSVKPTKEQVQALIPGLKARVMKAARHLSSTRMAREMKHPGIDWRGSAKGSQAEGVAERLCGLARWGSGFESPRIPTESEIEAACRRFRIAENSDGKFGVIEADREYLVAKIAAMRADIASDAAKLAVIKAAGKVNYAIENPMEAKKRDVLELERALRSLDGIVTPTHGVCSHCKATVPVQMRYTGLFTKHHDRKNHQACKGSYSAVQA
jgi:hypothetical protein